jgi:hypothetical protein
MAIRQRLLDRPAPPEKIVRIRQLAGQHLEQQFKYRYNKNIDRHINYRWIKSEWTYPSFEHFTFAYKNKLFPVFVELIEDGKSLMSENDINSLVVASDKYNLVPCIFKTKIISLKNNKLENHSSYNIKNDAIYPISNGWNLYDPLTNKDIIPEDLGTNLPTRLSEWELMNFSIQIVRDDIKKKGWKIFSFCDLPEINPQIWIEDNYNRRCWVIVRNIKTEEERNFHNWIKFIHNTNILEKFDGYFAPVRLVSDKGTSDLLRGAPAMVDYRGLQSAHLGH